MPVADTSFLIDLLNGRAAATDLLEALVGRQAPLWMAAVTLHELSYGAGLHHDPDGERARVRELRGALPVLPFTEDAALLAGRFEADRERDGARPGRMDIMIGATAAVHNEPIVTADQGFPLLPGLEVITY